MSRARLNADILALDLELTARRARLRASSRERVERLREVPPMLLLGGGVAAGLATGLLASCCGPRFYTLCGNGVRLWRLAGLVLPLASAPAAEAPVDAIVGEPW